MSYLLRFFSVVIVFVGGCFLAERAQANTGVSESLASEPLALEPWGLEHPGQIRFGVLSLQRQSADKAWHVHGLSRVMRENPFEIKPAASSRQPSGETVLLAQLNHEGKNKLGGSFGAFQRAPARAEFKLLKQVDGRFALTLSSFRESPENDAGFAGAWIQLCDPQNRIFLDARPYDAFSFWVRGRGNYRIKLADRHWFDKDDALTLGPLEDYVVSGALNGSWQQVQVPLQTLPSSLNQSELATLVIENLGPGFGQLAVSTLALTKKNQPALALLPVPDRKDPKAAQDKTNHQKRVNRATWIWHTEDWLKNPQWLQQELPFLQQQAVTDLYLQWPGSFMAVQGQGTTELAQLIQLLHTKGFRVHALEGDPHFALKAEHAQLEKIVQAILSFNRSVSEESRFDGVQFDIEPYLLPEFYGAEQEKIKTEFLTLVAHLYQTFQQNHLLFGLALPVWLEQADEFTGQYDRLSFQGQEALLSEHLQLHSDYIAVMDYRTKVWGASGIVSGVKNELEFARKHHKEVIIGLETMPLPDERLYLLKGGPSQQRPNSKDVLMLWSRRASDKKVWQIDYLAHDMPTPERVHAEVYYWPLNLYAQIPASALSFSDTTLNDLTRTLDVLETELQMEPAYAGLALHHGRSWAQLKSKPESQE